MSISRRDALVAVVGCGLTATSAAGSDEKPAAKEAPKPDPVYSHLPNDIRKVYEDTFPNHRCVRLTIRGEKDKAVYRATVFDLASMSASVQQVGGELICTPQLFRLELDARGQVLEETRRPIEKERVPKAVAAAYDQWNPKELKRMATLWSTEVARGKDRVYDVTILVNQLKAYRASFKEDGTILSADKIDWP